ncbi:MAG: Asp-tRNA(Asn)/Glu-tRNA(Gln) amidotransferase subunit GatC [Candidatus Acetothermia bacterium]|nr:Asp-tRNA(Asn)/Glu-tRNA(Gln) amidotransferase subunit GatC [Candidatus Bipolaricaulota bacterium]
MIDENRVKHVEELAELSLTEEERKGMAEDLGSIIDYVNKLKELDTGDVEPLRHILGVENVFREDERGETLSHEEVFKNAPEEERNFFKVPRVIDND